MSGRNAFTFYITLAALRTSVMSQNDAFTDDFTPKCPRCACTARDPATS
jgi:hypothetical protein